MFAIALTVLAVFVLLLVSEYLTRRRREHPELSRKFVHITVGSFAAFWPLYLTWNQIVFLSIACMVVVGISRWLHLFRAIHSVQRPTWGEVYFAITVGVLALFVQDGWIYLAALLHMSLADGLAAVLGVKYGRSNQYRLFGGVKSVVGTATFFVCSVVILAAYGLGSTAGIGWPLLALVAAGSTILESLGIKGLDNLLVPAFVAGMLLAF